MPNFWDHPVNCGRIRALCATPVGLGLEIHTGKVCGSDKWLIGLHEE